jgi:hypothetical protein
MASGVDLESSYFLSRRSIFEAMPLREGAVIFAGDSLTEQCAWGELLQSPLVLGRGIGGEPIAGLRLRLAEVLRHRPRQMILLSGVNNLLQGADVESLALEHRALVEEVLQSQPHVQVVIQSLLPVSEANFAAQPTAASRRQREMNAAIVQVNQTLRDLTLHCGRASRVRRTSTRISLTAPVNWTPPVPWDGLH